jgi:hypothetical protein
METLCKFCGWYIRCCRRVQTQCDGVKDFFAELVELNRGSATCNHKAKTDTRVDFLNQIASANAQPDQLDVHALEELEAQLMQLELAAIGKCGSDSSSGKSAGETPKLKKVFGDDAVAASPVPPINPIAAEAPTEARRLRPSTSALMRSRSKPSLFSPSNHSPSNAEANSKLLQISAKDIPQYSLNALPAGAVSSTSPQQQLIPLTGKRIPDEDDEATSPVIRRLHTTDDIAVALLERFGR